MGLRFADRVKSYSNFELSTPPIKFFSFFKSLPNNILILVEQVICCKLTPLQVELYKLFCKSCNIDALDTGDDGKDKIVGTTLSAITQMKKLCNRMYINIYKLDNLAVIAL